MHNVNVLIHRSLWQDLHDGLTGDRASPRHQAYDAMLQKLRATKSQLFALHEAHELTIKHQVRFNAALAGVDSISQRVGVGGVDHKAEI